MYSFEQWFSKRKNWVCPFTGGSKKSHNWFSPLTGVFKKLKDSCHRTYPNPSVLSSFWESSFFEKLQKPKNRDSFDSKTIQEPELEVLRFWKFSKSGIGVSLICKIKKTQDLRFSTKSKNHPSWWELHVRNWKNQTWTRSDFQNWNQIFINTIRPRRWGYSVAKSDPAPV
jgi:hypothetical protein